MTFIEFRPRGCMQSKMELSLKGRACTGWGEADVSRVLGTFLLALALFWVVLMVDVTIAWRMPWGAATAAYWLVLYGCWLGLCPLYLAVKHSLRLGSMLLGLSSVLWSFEDSLYYYLRGHPPFSPFPDHPGMYPLLVYWWPVWFLILSRLFAGLIILVYTFMNPDWGEEAAKVSLGSEQVRWILKVALVICVGAIIAWASYSYYMASGFGGRIVYRTDPSYGREPWPETVYRGVLVRKAVKVASYNPYTKIETLNAEVRYVLVRPGNLSELMLAKPYWMLGSDAPSVLDSYLDKEVEVLGKLVERQHRRELFAGRIREATENE